MIPEHVITLVLLFAAVLVLARWGVAIFLAYTCFHLWGGEWFEAGLAFSGACFIAVVRAMANWLDWNTSGRSAWLRRESTRFPWSLC